MAAGGWSTCGASCSRCCSPRCTRATTRRSPSRRQGRPPPAPRCASGSRAAWAEGRFDAELARLAARFGSFDAEALFFGHQPKYRCSDDYERFVYQSLADDLREAEVPDGASPVKSAAQVFRIFRDKMRSVVELGGLSLDSYLDFNADICSRIHRLVAGPPALRTRQFLALMDAGVVRMPYGPAPARGRAVTDLDPTASSDPDLLNRVRAAVRGGRRRPDPGASRRAADRRLGVAAAHAALQPRPGEPVPLRRGGGRQRRPDGRLSPDRYRGPAPDEHLDVRGADRGRPSLHRSTSRHLAAGCAPSRTSAPAWRRSWATPP